MEVLIVGALLFFGLVLAVGAIIFFITWLSALVEAVFILIGRGIKKLRPSEEVQIHAHRG